MARSSWIPRLESASSSSAFAAALAFELVTHLPFLDLPYHWDELGYFVPAAHDLLTTGALVPRSTLANVHPPLLMAYLAAAWKLFGFTVPVTRVAMLVVGAATLAATFVLARRLAGGRVGLAAGALLAVSPPFVAQSLLAHLDLAATFWTLLALYWFLDRRWWLAGAAATALTLTKETGVLVPLVLAVLARREGRRLLPLGLPLVALGCWLVYVRSVTGYWLGNAEFERYNVGEALALGRIPLVFLRRLYQLGVANFHWIAAAALATRWRRATGGPAWRPVVAVLSAYVVLHSVFGGAILLRYLLPAVALFYIAAAAVLPRIAWAALLAGLVVSNWWNPPYPFGYEDNLAVVDFVRLQQQAARFLSEQMPDRIITTAWPLTDALSTPLCGYVSRPLQVQPVEDFQPPAWESLSAARPDVVALYSRSWEPRWGWQRWGPVARLLERRFGYVPQVPREELMRRFGLRSAARWERRGQWMEILTAAPRDE